MKPLPGHMQKSILTEIEPILDTHLAAELAYSHTRDYSLFAIDLKRIDRAAALLEQELESEEKVISVIRGLPKIDQGAWHPARVGILVYGFMGELSDYASSLPCPQEMIAGSILHDIGQIRHPEFFGAKVGYSPKKGYKLAHVIDGAQILLDAGARQSAIDIALLHHKSYDGLRGYPKGPDVPPLHSQVVSIADEYAALTGIRSYRLMKYSPQNALQIMEESRQHEPGLLHKFSGLVAKLYPDEPKAQYMPRPANIEQKACDFVSKINKP